MISIKNSCVKILLKVHETLVQLAHNGVIVISHLKGERRRVTTLNEENCAR